MIGASSKVKAPLSAASEGWLEQAACRDVPDPDIFFPEKGEQAKAAQAKALCAGCPVSGACLDFALSGPQAANDVAGIYGGTTPQERHLLRVQRRRPPTPNRFAADRGAAIAALTRAEHIGITAAARELGVDATTLQRGWHRWGLQSPPPRRGPQRTRFYTDPDHARHALTLANTIGVNHAARQLGVGVETLYRAWDRHQLGRPIRARTTTGTATGSRIRHERDQERER